jgi:hypothetical protein
MAMPHDEAPLTSPEERRRRRGRVVLASLAVAALAAAVIGFVVERRTDGDAGPPPLVPLDVWAPYWTLGDTVDELSGRIRSIREVSPFWYRATGATEISIDPNANAAATDEFIRIARRSNARLIPSVIDAMPAGGMAAVLSNPTTRAQHVATVVAFVLDNDFDGVDLDYEQFAFADGRATWAATRPHWVAFIRSLAELHRRDKTLTVSIPPGVRRRPHRHLGFWVYDHGAIAEVVDHIRIMVYDFSTSSRPAPSPRSTSSAVPSTARSRWSTTPPRSCSGVPVYGYNWPDPRWATARPTPTAGCRSPLVRCTTCSNGVAERRCATTSGASGRSSTNSSSTTARRRARSSARCTTSTATARGAHPAGSRGRVRRRGAVGAGVRGRRRLGSHRRGDPASRSCDAPAERLVTFTHPG